MEKRFLEEFKNNNLNDVWKTNEYLEIVNKKRDSKKVEKRQLQRKEKQNKLCLGEKDLRKFLEQQKEILDRKNIKNCDWKKKLNFWKGSENDNLEIKKIFLINLSSIYWRKIFKKKDFGVRLFKIKKD